MAALVVAMGSELDLRAQLDYAVRGQAEEGRGRLSISGHQDEQLLPPTAHSSAFQRRCLAPAATFRRAPAAGGDERLTTQVKTRGGMPSTFAVVTGKPCGPVKHSLNA